MSRYVVIGGGISGLAAARWLAGAPPAGDGEPAPASRADSVILLESTERLGGKMLTGRWAGLEVELGPDQFLRRDPSAEVLSRQLGLGGALVAPAAASAAVYAGGRPRRLPAGLALGVPTDLDALASSGIVSAEAVEYARGDAGRPGPLLQPADVGLAGEEENEDAGGGATRERSGGALLRPRLGDEIVDRLVDPLIGGINAGSIDRLSLGTVAPQIAGALLGHRDVVAPLAGLAPRRRDGDSADSADGGGGGGGRAGPPSPFYGLEGGLSNLVERLGAELLELGCEVRLSTAAGLVRPATTGGGYLVETSGGDIAADGVILALPGGPAGAVLRQLAPGAGSLLTSLPYGSVAVVTFLLAGRLPEALRGMSGVLVPRVEGALMTAVTLLDEKWPWMSPQAPGRILVRVSAGRHLDDRIASLDDRRLCGSLASELAELTGIGGDVTDCLVQRWPKAFPQYEPGFPVRLATARQALAPHPGVALAGAVLGGIGIPACITSGERAAARVQAAVVAA